MTTTSINVIGAGYYLVKDKDESLAGSEAAWQIAKRGLKVRLYEMRPEKKTPAHHTQNFAELVCTNSLRANQLTNGAGLLKEEMRRLDSIIMEAADAHNVPAGGALAVDRETFSSAITEKLTNHPNVEVIREELTAIPEGLTVIATGPLTSDPLAQAIKRLTDDEGLYFYDAAAPIVEKSSLDMDKIYLKSRYDKGEAAYLNCPMTEEEFYNFYHELINAEMAELHDFEDQKFFEGCMPIEQMASRGEKTMLFGPLKPVGLEDPKTGKEPFAVVQLRQDNAAGNLYNLVGFQTHLKWGEQKRVFSMIPGLENAQFVRYGVMHRNTYLRSPEFLNATYQTKKRSDLLFAGQMTGVEGYVESAASGLYAALIAQGKEPVIFPEETMMGAMAHYITHASPKHFQPINANFGIIPRLEKRIREKRERNLALSQRALTVLEEFKTTADI